MLFRESSDTSIPGVARAVETVPSVANLRALADECVRLERHAEAIDLYNSALTGMHETEPGAMLGSPPPNSERAMPTRPATAFSLRTRISAPPKPICSQLVSSKPRVACPRRSALTSGSARLIPARKQRAGWRRCFREPGRSSERARSSPRSANRSNAAPRFIAEHSGNGTRSRAVMHELRRVDVGRTRLKAAIVASHSTKDETRLCPALTTPRLPRSIALSKSALTTGKRPVYQLLTALVVPRPVGWISTI